MCCVLQVTTPITKDTMAECNDEGDTSGRYDGGCEGGAADAYARVSWVSEARACGF